MTVIRRIVLVALTLILIGPGSVTAAPGDEVVPGTPRVDATFENIGLLWPITGDANKNASLTLQFRPAGAAFWRAGATAMKAEPTTPVDGSPLGLHYLAASALGVQPATTYEVQATLSDPDGGTTTSPIFTVTTRSEPTAPGSARVRHVSPGSGGGDGTTANPFRGLQAAASAAQPGDLFVVAPGTYAPFTVLASGTPSAPITFRGPSSGAAIVDGGGTDRGVVTLGSIATGGHDLIVEGLTIQNGAWGIDADSTRDITIRANVLRDVDHGIVNRRSNGAERNQTIVDNLISGRTVWPQSGIPGEQGIELRGDGNVVAYNRVDHFADCISIQPRSGRSYGNDVVGNDVSYCVDDGIQIDYNEANVRVWRNRVTNARMGVSVQPIRGGPAYIFRNEFLNLESNPIKMNNSPSGFIVIHNTSVKNGAGISDPAATWRNAIFRNNLMLGTQWYAFEFTTVPDEGFRDFDYNAWGTTWAGTSAEPRFKWNNVRYNTLAALQAAGVETHGVDVAFGDLVNHGLPPAWNIAVAPGTADLRPRPGTAPVNRGAVLANVNDGYVGDGQPDMGAFELGQPPVRYGPRSGNAVPPDPATPSRFVSFGPARQVDTRAGQQGGRLGANAVRPYTLRDVPLRATAVTLNVTAVDSEAPGYLSVFGCTTAVPPTSSLNYRPQRLAVPNQVTVGASSGQVCVLSHAATDVVIDLAGWWESDGPSELVADQQRLWDTRRQGGGAPDSLLTFDLTALSARFPALTSVSLNLTGVDGAGFGYLTAYDCTTGRPLASNVNVQPGVIAATHATVALSASRRLCVYTYSGADIVVDLTGWWVSSGQRRMQPNSPPIRRVDTRNAGSTVTRLRPDTTVTILPATPRQLFANVTADAPAGDGYIAVFSCGAGWGGTSTVNFDTGPAVANATIVDASSGVCARSNTAVELIFDVFGEAS